MIKIKIVPVSFISIDNNESKVNKCLEELQNDFCDIIDVNYYPNEGIYIIKYDNRK